MEKGTKGLIRQKPDYGRPWSGRRAWAVPVLAWPFTNQVTWQVQQVLFFPGPCSGLWEHSDDGTDPAFMEFAF